MAINAMIPLQGRSVDPLNALAQGYKLGNDIRQQPMVNSLNQEKLKAAKLANETADIQQDTAKMEQQKAFDELAKGSFQADYYGAVQLAPYLDAGDTNSVMGILEERRALKNKLGYPTTSEDNFLQQLQSNPESAKGVIKQVIERGQQLFGRSQGRSVALSPGGQLYGSDGTLLAENTNATAAQEKAALESQQNAALAALIGGRQPAGSIPPPIPGGAPNSPFAGLPPDQIKNLPPRVLEKEIERLTDPKQLDYNEQQSKKKEFQERATGLLGDLLGNVGGVKAAVGTIDSKTPTLLPSTAEAENKIGQLRSILTADNLKLMSGVLSETDMKVLREISAGQLDTNRDQNEFIKDLNALYNKLSGMSGQVDRSGASYDLEYDPATGGFK